MNKKIFLLFFSLLVAGTTWAADPLLSGRAIGSSPSFDYNTGQSTTTTNLPSAAFDGDLSTFYASNQRSYTWVGLDLGKQYIITKVGWSPRNDGVGPGRTRLAMFEGANRADFSDALPLYITDEQGVIGQISTAEVNCSKGFRYVRYVGPNDAKCNVAEVQFYGHAGAGTDDGLYRPTNLPCVIIRTQNQREPLDKVNDIVSVVTILGEDGSVLTDSATVRCRGNASLGFPKKPYRIKFAHKQRVLDAPANAKKWTLINNYGDKTLIRNMVAFQYSRILGYPYTPYCQPVDVILNGEYKGCYQLCDQLEVRKNRIDIDEMTPRDVNGLALTGGYHIEMDGYAYEEPDKSRFYTTRWGMGFTIKSPEEDSIVNAQKNYIRNHVNAMEDAVYTRTNWRKYLHEDSFLKHFIVGELTGNTDTYWSCHFYKQRGNDTIYAGPEWDFDIAFDNDYRQYPTCNKSDFVYVSAGTNKSFVSNIVKNDVASVRRLTYLWSDARLNKGLTPEAICEMIDDYAAYLDASQRLNFMRWPILSQNVHMNPRNAGSYAGEITFLKNYVTNRFAWMDRKIGVDQSVKSTDLQDLQTTDNQAEKVLINGRLYIIRDNKIYDILGNIWNEK